MIELPSITQTTAQPAAKLWECYGKGPESGPDPSQWQTQLDRALAS